MNLQLFATDAHPLHPSGLKNLLTCPWRGVLETMLTGDDDAGPAADTGSATHKAIQLWHEGATAAEAIAAMGGLRNSYPRADLAEAATLFLGYTVVEADSEVVAVELPICFHIAPASDDPTGAPVVVEGTCDQVRRHKADNRLRTWDVKTTKKDPLHCLRESMHQLAAYTIGATFELGEQVHPGGVIMPRRNPMFIPVSWSLDDAVELLAPIPRRVAEIRRGVVDHVPTHANCEWCCAGGPELCAPRKRRSLL